MREEGEWLGALASKGQSNTKKASSSRGRRNSSQFQNAAIRQTPATTPCTSKAASKAVDSSPDVSEDESAMSALSNMQNGGTPTSDLYHKYRYTIFASLGVFNYFDKVHALKSFGVEIYLRQSRYDISVNLLDLQM